MRYGSEASAYPGAPIPFKRFADWIFRIAETYSDPNFARKTIYTTYPKDEDPSLAPKDLPGLMNRAATDQRANVPNTPYFNRGYVKPSIPWRSSQTSSSPGPSIRPKDGSPPDSSSRNVGFVTGGATTFKTTGKYPDSVWKGSELSTILEIDEYSPIDSSTRESSRLEIEHWCAYCSFSKEISHSIHEYPSFRKLSQQERQAFVRDQQLCFGCLMKGHLVGNCPTKPTRCNSCRRIHNDLIGCTFIIPNPIKPAGMWSTNSPTHYPTYCRTCPVWLSHRSDPTKTVKGLAIIDEGSAVTLVGKEVLSQLQIPSQHLSPTPFMITTGDRTTPLHTQRSVRGLRVAPLVEPASYAEISECIEWKNLPQSIGEVATPEEVARMSGLEHLKNLFPPVDPSWPTLVLLGRDCLWAMQHKQFIPPKENGPMAVHTPLGWALIGPKQHISRPESEGTSPVKVNHVGAKIFRTQLRLIEGLPAKLNKEVSNDIQMELSSDEERKLLAELLPCVCSTPYSSTSPPIFARPEQAFIPPQGKIPIEMGNERREQRLQKAQKHIKTFQLPKFNKDLRYHSAQPPKITKASHVRLRRMQNVRQVMGIGSTGIRLRWLRLNTKAPNLLSFSNMPGDRNVIR